MIRWDAPAAIAARAAGEQGKFWEMHDKIFADQAHMDRPTYEKYAGELGLDASRLAFNRQRHSAATLRADPRATGRDGDGLWTDEAGLPLLALTADCLPDHVAATNGRRASRSSTRARARRRRRGEAVAALGDGPAAVGPAPRSARAATRWADMAALHPTSRDGILDLWSAGERAPPRRSRPRDRVDLCTRCREDMFFSHRRQGRVRGVQGVIGALAG
jgi:hypothetical protein